MCVRHAARPAFRQLGEQRHDVSVRLFPEDYFDSLLFFAFLGQVNPHSIQLIKLGDIKHISRAFAVELYLPRLLRSFLRCVGININLPNYMIALHAGHSVTPNTKEPSAIMRNL